MDLAAKPSPDAADSTLDSRAAIRSRKPNASNPSPDASDPAPDLHVSRRLRPRKPAAGSAAVSPAPKRPRSSPTAPGQLDGSNAKPATKRSRRDSVSAAVAAADTVPDDRYPWFGRALRSEARYDGAEFSRDDLVACRDWYTDVIEGRAPEALEAWDTAHMELSKLFAELHELEEREKQHLRRIEYLEGQCRELEGQLENVMSCT